MYPWSESVYNNTNGYAIIEATNASYLYWSFINSADDTVLDRMLLIQGDVPHFTDDITDGPAEQLSSGAIAAIVIVSIGVVAGVVVSFMFREKLLKWFNRSQNTNNVDKSQTVMSPFAAHDQFRDGALTL